MGTEVVVDVGMELTEQGRDEGCVEGRGGGVVPEGGGEERCESDEWVANGRDSALALQIRQSHSTTIGDELSDSAEPPTLWAWPLLVGGAPERESEAGVLDLQAVQSWPFTHTRWPSDFSQLWQHLSLYLLRIKMIIS